MRSISRDRFINGSFDGFNLSLRFGKSRRRPPLVGRAGQQQVNKGHRDRHRGQAPEQSVRPKQFELHEARSHSNKHGEKNSARAGIRRGFWIRDHEEGENPKRSIFKAVQRYGQAFAKPKRTSEKNHEPPEKESDSETPSRRPVYHQTAEADHQ